MGGVYLSVVVPCYNEQTVLPELKRRLMAVCRQQVGDAYEVILVNDGSRDGTWAQITRMAAATPSIVGVNLSRHVGHQLALTAGLTLCRGDRVLIIDADLQDPPELLPEMMAAMDRGGRSGVRPTSEARRRGPLSVRSRAQVRRHDQVPVLEDGAVCGRRDHGFFDNAAPDRLVARGAVLPGSCSFSARSSRTSAL